MKALSIEDEACKQDYPKDEKENQQGELLGRSFEGVDQNSETWWVSGQLEEAEDPGYRQYLEIQAGFREELGVKAERCGQVYRVQWRHSESLQAWVYLQPVYRGLWELINWFRLKLSSSKGFSSFLFYFIFG